MRSIPILCPALQGPSWWLGVPLVLFDGPQVLPGLARAEISLFFRGKRARFGAPKGRIPGRGEVMDLFLWMKSLPARVPSTI